MKAKNLDVQPTALLAELVGTFILATVAITVANPIIVGFVMVILVFAIGAVSGAHVNPAVTFALWAARKLDGVKVPFYWVMQFAGALAALLVSQWYQGAGHHISFASFGSLNGKIFVAELLGTAVFTFAVAAAVHRNLSESAKALCIGLGLLTGLAVGGGLLGVASQTAATATSTKDADSRLAKVDGVTINPAIALASTEKVEQTSLQSLTGQTAAAAPKQPASRLTWESILGPLLGGAIGANLFMLTAGINPFEKKKQTVAAKVATAVKSTAKTTKKVVKKAKK
jgi:aquaporin Z